MKLNLIGVVVGTKMMKTAKVRVPRLKMHPRVKKVVVFYLGNIGPQKLFCSRRKRSMQTGRCCENSAMC